MEKSTVECPPKFVKNQENDSAHILSVFTEWSEQAQTEFFNNALSRLSHSQLKLFDQILNPLLQKDIVGGLVDCALSHISARILDFLDAKSLKAASEVSRQWHEVIYSHQTWRNLITNKLKTQPVWWKLLSTSNYESLFIDEQINPASLPRDIYEKIYYKLEALEGIIHNNWQEGKYKLDRISCDNDINRGVYCIQYDNDKIICGLRDNTIKVWSMRNHQLLRTLKGHEGSVLCLQYKDKFLISGSSDSTIRVWNHETRQEYEKIECHKEPVLHLKFNDSFLITCSKDYTITIFKIEKFLPVPKLTHFMTLREHKAAVNVIDFDDRYLVSASGDRTIKVWEMGCFNCIQTLSGHRRGIACLQFQDNLIISGSSDHTIRVWDINLGSCIRILFGHEELVRCIRFDSNFIISGAYDGKIKVWNLAEVADKNVPHVGLKATTLCEHTSRVFKLQFDAFKIVSSSQDDTILIWDFLGLSHEELEQFWNLKMSTPKNVPPLPTPVPYKVPESLSPTSHLKTAMITSSTSTDNNYPVLQLPYSKVPKTSRPCENTVKKLNASTSSMNANFVTEEGESNISYCRNKNLTALVDQRENHPFSRMLRKCLSLKKTKKDQSVMSSENDSSFKLSTSELPNESNLGEVFINKDSLEIVSTNFLKTQQQMKRTNIFMETDSPMKEGSTSSSNQEEEDEVPTTPGSTRRRYHHHHNSSSFRNEDDHHL